jgi:thioester reductase-like protein
MSRPHRTDSSILLTGATGLLGRSLVRDLAATGHRVAVIVRGSKAGDAATRVDELLRDWQEVAGAHVPCPVVLEGDLTAEGLGLAPEQRAWIAANVREVVHSAASLVFGRREADGEPYTSNVGGTRNVLALCRDTGIRRLHHVSSAYVCGLRTGTVLERELDVGQTSGNDYERSKISSEGEATSTDFLDVVTVHRPSIIVGDVVHGFTNTFHGFYRPLRIVMPFVEAFVDATLPRGSLLAVMGMDGHESKNLVPVDWVSAAMTRIIGDESLHGRTYHLTAETPTTVGTLCRVFEQLVFELVAERRRQRAADAAAGVDPTVASHADPEALGQMFLDQMDVYRAYWRDDPVFDTTNTRSAVPDLPAPPVDEPLIRRLCRFAIDNRFRWPPAGRRQPLAAARLLLGALFGEAEWTAPRTDRVIGLAATGPGGGQWTIAIDQGQPLSLHMGLPAAHTPTCWLAASALTELIEGRATLELLRGRGAVLVEGDEAGRRIALDVLGSLAPSRRGLVTA